MSNADIIKQALIDVQTFIDDNNLPISIILAVYDEIQTECPEDLSEYWKDKLSELMINAAKTVIKSVPVKVDCKINDYWSK